VLYLVARPALAGPVETEDEMKSSILNAVPTLGAFGLAALVAADPAIAGLPVPGPLLAAGAPALVVIGGGYWLIRRYRRR
jgi:hypothetical protein